MRIRARLQQVKDQHRDLEDMLRYAQEHGSDDELRAIQTQMNQLRTQRNSLEEELEPSVEVAGGRRS